MKKSLFILLIISTIFTSCSTAVRFSSSEYSKYEDTGTGVVNVMYGKASYYGDEFNGNKTSSGDIFDNKKYTAAHKTLPFGTFVKVTNLLNGKSVIVKINDRGPHIAGRVIDLSKAAAEELDMIREGVIDVKLEILK